MVKPVNLLSSRMGLFKRILSTLKDGKKSPDSPLLFIFWGSRGSGKTTFLNTVKEKLSSNSDVEILGLWDAKDLTVRKQLSNSIRENLGKKSSKTKLILIDNLDALLEDTSGTELFDFESNTLLPLIQRGDTIIIACSQIEINLWQEYDVRVRQQNHQLTPLRIDEIQEVLHGTAIDSDYAHAITFGHPKILEEFLAHPDWTKKEASAYAHKYFLDGFPNDIKELTEKASIFPVFDIFILRKIMDGKTEDDKKDQTDMLTGYNDKINELTRRWIVQFDIQVGAYRFTDDAVRRLISRNTELTFNNEFIHIHQIAAEYYQEEAKNTSYLEQLFVSAIYHLAHAQTSKSKDKPGAICLRWVKEMQNRWFGANWEQVLNAWESGSGNNTVKEEIILLIDPKYYSKITELLSKNKIRSEV
jgi:GTPase SAR1 family protein